MADAQCELWFGDAPLVPADPSSLAYEVNTLAELDFGNPEPVVAPIQSLLLDGSLAEVLSYDNRNIVIRVEITGPTLADVAEGERALMAEVGGRNTLTWHPPDEFSSPTVFDVIWSRFDWTPDDLDEVKRRKRTFVITLNCAPFGRDADETYVEAVASGATPPTPSTATVDDGTSTSGWAVSRSLTSTALGPLVGPTVVSGAVQASTSGTGFNFAYDFALSRTGLAASMTTTPFLMVQATMSGSGRSSAALSFAINGDAAKPIAQNGETYYFDCSAITTVTSVDVTYSLTARSSISFTHTATLRVLDISRTNVPPFVGTGRMLSRRLTVGGSARTEASLALAHETLALGEVRVYTNAADVNPGYQPPLRQYRNNAFGGTVTPDTSTVSGGRSMLNAGTPETYDVPASALIAGTHQLEVLVRGTAGPRAITYSVSTLVGTTEHGTTTGVIPFTLLGADWQFVSLQVLPLPPVALPLGSSSKVRIELSSTSALEIDDGFIFNTDVGQVTGVVCGTGTPTAGGASSKVWIDTPTLDWPNPAIWLGTTAGRDDARHAIGGNAAEGGESPAITTHLFNPGDVNLLTICTGATNVAASLRYHRRHQHNRGD